MQPSTMLIIGNPKTNGGSHAQLFSAQFTIATVLCGQDAMTYLAEHPGLVAIILLDLTDPQSQGQAFMSWLLTSTNSEIPVIAVVPSALQEETLAQGAWDVVTPPLNARVLKARVNNVLGHHRYLRERETTDHLEAMNRELETAKRKVDHLVNTIPGGIAIYRVTDRFETLYFSDGVAALSGHTPEEYMAAIGLDATSLVYPADKKRLLSKTITALQNNQSIDEIYRIYHKDGHPLWVHLNGLPMEHNDEGVLVYAVFQNISAQTKLYQRMLDKTKTAVYACDIETYDILYFNQQMATITETCLPPLAGEKCYHYFFHRDTPCTFCRMGQMKRDVMISRQFTFPPTNHIYELKGTLIDWNRITAHVEYITDITVEKRSQEQLMAANDAMTEQQLRYEVAIRSSGINIWEYDIQGDCLTVVSNSSRIKQNCYTIEDYVASTVEHDYVRPDSLKSFYNIFNQLRSGAKEVTEDIWYKTTDEAGWWCERVTYTTVFDEDGRPLKAFGAGRDVTREKDALRKFEEELHLRTAIQGKNLSTLKINLTQNTILEGKSTFPEVRAWIAQGSADAYFKHTAQTIVRATDQDHYRQKINRQALINDFKSGNFTLSTTITRHLDPRHICFLAYNVHLMVNGDNDDIIAFIIAHDITEEKMMSMVMETISQTDYEFFVVVDGLLNSATDYGTVNREPLFHPHESFEGRLAELLTQNVCSEDLTRVLSLCTIANIIAHIQKGKVYKFNYSRHGEDGTLRRKQLQFTLIDPARKTFLMTRIDVNAVYLEQKENQLKLEAALTEAQSATKAKTDFLSRMSHDIRTPLNAVIGLSDLGRESDSMEEMRAYYRQIESSGKYLLAIINDVLDMSKIEGQTMELHPTVVHLPHFIEDTIAIVMPMITEKHIDFEVKETGISTKYLRFDTTYVRQVAVNLLSNAVKFTPEGGHIELCLENISRTEHAVYNRMIVRDTGIGIGKEFLPKVFLPFEQENDNNDIMRKGTGLGLSIVKSIVTLMNGTIRVESERGKGTAFIVEWHFDTVTPDEIPDQGIATPHALATLAGRRILLCEDHPLNTQIATKVLQKEGIVVIHAANGQEAIDQFSKAPAHYFDAILMDIRMPVMDGLKATRCIRLMDRPDAQTVPIIAMTANAFMEDVQKSLHAGMDAHLAKPIEPAKLYLCLAQLMAPSDPA